MRPALLLLVLCLATLTSLQAQDSRPASPNIVLIVADDQGYADLGCAGLAADEATPNLDRLAESGVRFTTAYATSPICNASRAGLMTGCYQQRFGTFWYGGRGLCDPSFPTLAELLGTRGYATGYIGKFHYGGVKAHRPGQRSFPLDHGFEHFFGFSGGRKHYLVHEAAAEARFQKARKEHQRKGQSLRQGPMWRGTELVDEHGLSTELFGEEARRFLREQREGPFFLQLAFNAVHNFTHQLPDDYLRKHGLSGYRDWDPAKEKYYDWYRQGRKPNNPEGRAHYLGQLHFLDREVGRVLDALEKLGLRENTAVVFIGDNGGSTPIYADNGPLRGSKYTLYEGGIRVPLIISWPGHFPAPSVCSNVVSALDLLPTLCALAGAEVPKRCDGIDLGPLLRGTAPGLHHDLLIWDTGHETAVRRGDWKLRTATTNAHATYEMVELELGTFLYDLAADPGERENLAAQYPDRVRELSVRYRSWRAALQGK